MGLAADETRSNSKPCDFYLLSSYRHKALQFKARPPSFAHIPKRRQIVLWNIDSVLALIKLTVVTLQQAEVFYFIHFNFILLFCTFLPVLHAGLQATGIYCAYRMLIILYAVHSVCWSYHILLIPCGFYTVCCLHQRWRRIKCQIKLEAYILIGKIFFISTVPYTPDFCSGNQSVIF